MCQFFISRKKFRCGHEFSDERSAKVNLCPAASSQNRAYQTEVLPETIFAIEGSFQQQLLLARAVIVDFQVAGFGVW